MARATRKSQQALTFDPPDLTGVVTPALPEAFRRLYFHLYSNSRASRAERIIEDLSLLLLAKLAAETNGGAEALSKVRHQRGSANSLLIPLLRKTFPRLVDAGQRFSIGDEAARTALLSLDCVNLSTAPAHVLGEAFQALMGPRLRGDKGQFFTPRSLVRAMVEIIAPEPHESVLDPACGTGGFLLEAYAFQSSRPAFRSQADVRIVGVDKDHDLFRLSSALLQIATRGSATVLNQDSLEPATWKRTPELREGFDVVLTNPPFGARIPIRDQETLESYDLGHQWIEHDHREWTRTSGLLPAQDPQVLFVELCVRQLKPGGRMGIVLPEGLFGNARDSYIWEWLRTHGTITGLLDCPRTTFQPGTDTKTNVLFFKKFADGEAAPKSRRQQVRIAVALQCGHDRRGRSNYADGRPYPDDFSKIGRAFHAPQSRDNPWRIARITVGDYVVPRYYSEEAPLTDQESAITSGATLVTIRDLVSSGVLAVRKGNEVGSDAYGTGEVPFVRTSDISNFEISTDPTKAVSEEIYEEYRDQQKLKSGDVLMVVDGRYRIGATAMLTPRTVRCVVQSHLRIISVLDPERIDPYELLYALNLPSVKLRIRDLVFVQSTLGTLGRRLFELKIPMLHGDGPWRERVDHFRRVLVQRDELLGELQAVGGTDYEL
jgi:type I restriction enzyme M protein